jgi:hypothetical protein
MQMTAERKTLLTRIGLGAVAVVLVAAITVTIAHLLNPPAKPTVASTSSHVASTAPVTTPAVPVGSTQSVDSLMNQDATSEDSINATYENNNVAASQAVSQAAANVGSAYNESNF